jgi:hypothetical protein
MSDEKTKQLLNRVHAAIVDVITKGLEEGTINENRAKEIAQMVLERLPDDINYEELMKILPKLDDDFQELTVAILPIMLEYEAKVKQIVNHKISQLLKEKRFQEALFLARKAIEFEKGLS